MRCEELIPRQFGGGKVIQQVAEIFKTRAQAEWIDIFRDTDACCEPVLAMPEVVDSDICRQRCLTNRTVSGTLTPVCPIKSVNQPSHIAAEVPSLGEHNTALKHENTLPGETNGI